MSYETRIYSLPWPGGGEPPQESLNTQKTITQLNFRTDCADGSVCYTNHMKEKMLKYTVMYEPAEEGGYVVRIPTLGAATQGETLEEAQAMAKECIEANIIGLQELTKKVFT